MNLRASNFVRACFCIPHGITADEFYALLDGLQEFDCTYNVSVRGQVSGFLLETGEQIVVTNASPYAASSSAELHRIAQWLAVPGYIDVTLGWRVEGVTYIARVLQNWPEAGRVRSVSFDVQEAAFFPGSALEFVPNRGVLFETYRRMIIELIRYLRPALGAIDYEADLLCNDMRRARSFVSWGNYLADDLLDAWPDASRLAFMQLVDECYPLSQLGILTFLHPLRVNQAWTSRHEKIEALLRENPIILPQLAELPACVKESESSKG